MKRRDSQERDDAIARDQAESRREQLLADLKAREAAGRDPEPEPDDQPVADPAAEPDGDEPEAADEASEAS